MTQTASKYARVLWELEMPAESVKEAAQLFEQEPALSQALANPETYLQDKYAVIDRIFSKEIRNFLKYLCKAGDISFLPEIAEAYQDFVDQHQSVLKAKLYYVTPPTDQQLSSMKEVLCREHHVQQVEIEQIEDKSLVGGFILSAGGREYDWSLRGRLQNLENVLTGR